MAPTRREFIKNVGVAFASLAMARCICPIGEDGFTGSKGDSSQERVRQSWMGLDWLAQKTQDWDDYERGEQALNQLVADHQAALDELVASGELDADVAGQVQTAFDAAAYHVWRSNAPITCYEPVMIDYKPTSSNQLAQQSELLTEMSESGDLDPNTVAQAQAAIERDIAFLNLSSAETQALYDELMAAADDSYAFPAFDELELEVTPEAVKAARFLVELLLEN
ncbi:MAG: hypothetical protein GY832_12960 [Chloroflexi bacterium]|nr:hypothetical protein [Chloroflexota bacterium]